MPTDQTRAEPGAPLHIEAEQYLADLWSLSSELDRAMKALVNRELSSLQDSVRRQRETCARLAFFAQGSSSRQGSRARFICNPSQDTAEPRPDVASEIKAAIETLLALNKTYSALLRHSGDTLRMFAALFQEQQSLSPIDPCGKFNLRTWSCEL